MSVDTPTNLAAVEAMARAMCEALYPRGWPIKSAPLRAAWEAQAQAALTALTTLHPGIGAVLRGEAVVVPKIQGRCVEPECCDYGQPVGRTCRCYREAKEVTRAAIETIGGVL